MKNDVKTDALQLCVQGTFTVEGYARGRTDTRWQTIAELAELAESCSREDFATGRQPVIGPWRHRVAPSRGHQHRRAPMHRGPGEGTRGARAAARRRGLDPPKSHSALR